MLLSQLFPSAAADDFDDYGEDSVLYLYLLLVSESNWYKETELHCDSFIHIIRRILIICNLHRNFIPVRACIASGDKSNI